MLIVPDWGLVDWFIPEKWNQNIYAQFREDQSSFSRGIDSFIFETLNCEQRLHQMSPSEPSLINLDEIL